MKTVGEYVTHASRQLNDQRPNRAFTRWGRDLLLDYLVLGLGEIATYRPEALATEIEHTLTPGAVQTVDTKYTIVNVVANEDGTPIVEGDTRMASAFGAYAVCEDSGISFVKGNPVYHARTYSVDKGNASTFYLDPPAPKGMEVKVKINVTGDSLNYGLEDWNKELRVSHKFSAVLIDYILACAYGLDMESPQSRARSDSLYRRFYDIMGVKYRQESKFKSGYYLGELGTKDIQAGNR